MKNSLELEVVARVDDARALRRGLMSETGGIHSFSMCKGLLTEIMEYSGISQDIQQGYSEVKLLEWTPHKL